MAVEDQYENEEDNKVDDTNRHPLNAIGDLCDDNKR
jgi:hypothetical protein